MNSGLDAASCLSANRSSVKFISESNFKAFFFSDGARIRLRLGSERPETLKIETWRDLCWINYNPSPLRLAVGCSDISMVLIFHFELKKSLRKRRVEFMRRRAVCFTGIDRVNRGFRELGGAGSI